MNKLSLFTLFFLVSSCVKAEIPIWYKEAISRDIRNAYALIQYKVSSVSLLKATGVYHTYRIDTETIEIFKGEAPEGNCYFINTEGEWENIKIESDESVVLLMQEYSGECGVIEPGYGAPATQEYLEFFKKVIGDA